MRKQLKNLTIEQLILEWESKTGVQVTEELLQTPHFVQSLISMEWNNIEQGKYN